jgi:exosortase
LPTLPAVVRGGRWVVMEKHRMVAMLPHRRRGLLAVPAALWLGIVVALALIWVFWPTLTDLAARWGSDSRYSHGYLVPLFAGYLVWARRGLFTPEGARLSWLGLPLLLAGLALRFTGTYLYFDWLTAVALLPCLAGLVLMVGGWRALACAWPAIAFLVLMVPLPFRVEVALAHPLQRVATIASTYALQTLGFAAFSEGNVIRLGDVRIGVVEACSGLSMLMIFFALSTAVSLLIRRSWPIRGIIFISAVPIALIANITRITVTAILYKTVGSELADYVFHDLAGWLMMPLALVLMWGELMVLNWVFPPPTDEEPAAMPFSMLAPGVRVTSRPAEAVSKHKTAVTAASPPVVAAPAESTAITTPP